MIDILDKTHCKRKASRRMYKYQYLQDGNVATKPSCHLSKRKLLTFKIDIKTCYVRLLYVHNLRVSKSRLLRTV